MKLGQRFVMVFYVMGISIRSICGMIWSKERVIGTR